MVNQAGKWARQWVMSPRKDASGARGGILGWPGMVAEIEQEQGEELRPWVVCGGANHDNQHGDLRVLDPTRP